MRPETRNDLKEFQMSDKKLENNRYKEIKITYSTDDLDPEVLAEMVREQVLYKYDDVFGDPEKIEPTADYKKLEITFGQNKVDKKVFLIDLNGLGYAYEISWILTDPNYEV